MIQNTKIRIILIEPVSSKLKLNFVKLLKKFTDLGLKECKELCDNLHDFPQVYQTLEVKTENLMEFSIELKKVGEFKHTGDTDWQRNLQILKLGLGSCNDYIEFVEDYIQYNFDNSKNIVNFILSKLSKEQIIDVFEQINIYNNLKNK